MTNDNAADAGRDQWLEIRGPNRTKISLDLDTGKLTLPRGDWELVLTGGGSATISAISVKGEPEDFAIEGLHQDRAGDRLAGLAEARHPYADQEPWEAP